ncbi:MAG: 50S ribosome-binding GTPase [Candidatus Cloacimonetes bacterium]|nr:50S ribosome-binding GTPase [Candidatus Cloacimonadota bacterium]
MAKYIDRFNIGIFGRMNAGKSSLMNLITQHNTSIVDPTPGTTADTKTALYELHGVGPARIFDTAGIDESSTLGEKKRDKVYSVLKESDLVLLVIDPSRKDFLPEKEIVEEARNRDKQMFVVYNIFKEKDMSEISKVEEEVPLLKFHKKIILSADKQEYRLPLTEFIKNNFEYEKTEQKLLPFVEKDEFYIMIIPMDDETPQERFLRPQAMTEEYITRHWAYPIAYRLDLNAARSENSLNERTRFEKLINGLGKRPKCIITDSQAMDIMSKWCPEDIALTTFSIIMIQFMSNGRLKKFADGIKNLSKLKKGDSILIVEACNHDRVSEDIGTVQIPAILNRKFPGVEIEHNFGREFQENKSLGKYSLIIHCGGCMISKQKLISRIRDIESLNIPYTNYGVFLSAVQGENALRKVLQVWEISI